MPHHVSTTHIARAPTVLLAGRLFMLGTAAFVIAVVCKLQLAVGELQTSAEQLALRVVPSTIIGMAVVASSLVLRVGGALS